MQKGKIYKIINNVNNQIYIGCTINSLTNRFNEHLYRCFKTDYNSKLYSSMKKYGKENFTIELIEECDVEKIYTTEKKYIQEYDSYYNGLNSTFGGEGCLGYVHSDEIKKKISENVKNGNSHKGKSYQELYGELGEVEKKKRSNSVKKYWTEISEEQKNKRLSKLYLTCEKKSKFSKESKKDIKIKLDKGVKLNEIIKEYPDISYSMLYAIKKGDRWKNIKIK